LNTGYAIILLVTSVHVSGLPSSVAGPASQPNTWIPIVAPLLGGVVGAFIYDYTIGKVIEAKHLGKSGDAVTTGESVREPAV